MGFKLGSLEWNASTLTTWPQPRSTAWLYSNRSIVNTHVTYYFSFSAPLFRGCAETVYEFDPGCHRQLQSVDLIPGRSSANVEIYLCFCNGDKCNESANSGIVHLASCFVMAIALITIILFSDWGFNIFES